MGSKNASTSDESFSAGSRQDRPHGGDDAWQLGGRESERGTAATFDPDLAAQHAQAHADRQAGK